MIPKIIHLCWLSGDAFPEDIQRCLESWSVQLKGYEVWCWGKKPSDISCLGELTVVEKHFDLESVTWTREAFFAKKYAFAADYIRLNALLQYGGIYLDADVVVYKPFDELLHLPYFIGCDQINAFEAAVIGCEPGCDWIANMLASYEGKHFVQPDGTLDMLPLPCRFHHELTRLGYRFFKLSRISEFKNYSQEERVVQVFEGAFFNSRNAVEVRRTPRSFCAHNYAGSWSKKPGKQRDIKSFLPKWLLAAIYVVGQRTWARNKYAWFQIPFENSRSSYETKA